MRDFLAGLVLLAAFSSGASAQGAARRLDFSLEREGPATLQYAITVEEDGTGVYTQGVLADANGLQPAREPQHIHVGVAVVKKLFAAVPMVEGGRCETHSKGIAKTGVKKLQYSFAGREAQCTYNYSDDDRVNEATDAFEGIAETMQIGERLRAKLRFDRLGLDTELDGLQGAVTEGRALEVENIAPVLQTIAGDERVMDRARRKAERLLEVAGPSQTTAGVGSRLR